MISNIIQILDKKFSLGENIPKRPVKQTLDEAINRIPASDNFIKIVQEYFYQENQQNKDAKVTSADTYICYIASYIYIYFISQRDNKKFLRLLCRHIIKLEKAIQMLPYDFIAYLIYQHDLSQVIKDDDESRRDRENYVQLGIESLSEYEHERLQALRKIFSKLDRHVLLALHQKNYIRRNIAEISSEASEIKTQMQEMQSSLSNAQSELAKIIKASETLNVELTERSQTLAKK